MDGWMDGWMDGRESGVKDCLQQSMTGALVNSAMPLLLKIASTLSFTSVSRKNLSL
jgi:hypothetical protein